MTKSELIQKLSETNQDISYKQTAEGVNIILQEITNALSVGNRVELRGFGVFSARERKKRISRNPQTGSPINVGSKRVPFFKIGKQLQQKLNNQNK